MYQPSMVDLNLKVILVQLSMISAKKRKNNCVAQLRHVICFRSAKLQYSVHGKQVKLLFFLFFIK